MVYLDKPLDNLFSDVFAGRNLTSNQQTYPPVMFLPLLFRNVLRSEFVKTHPNYKNYSIRWEQGERKDEERL